MQNAENRWLMAIEDFIKTTDMAHSGAQIKEHKGNTRKYLPCHVFPLPPLSVEPSEEREEGRA